MVVIASLLLSSFVISAQDNTLNYDVFYKNNVVGNMQINKMVRDENVYLMMVSKVHMKLITSFRVHIKEQSQFNKGRLMYTNVYREVNGKVKANQKTTAVGDAYQIDSHGKTGTISNKSISSNLILLYFYEPVQMHEVYSGNFQQFVGVKPVGEHTYRIDLPDGNYNFYTYKDGICSRVEVHSSMYTIRMELRA